MIRLLHRLLRRILPVEFRRRHGSAMEEVFVEALRSRPRLEAPSLWFREVRDFVRTRRQYRASATLGRSGRGRGTPHIVGRLSGLSLDFRLGVRMMAKNPGITVLAVLTMALAIGICTATFELVSQLRQPNLRVQNGDGLVVIGIRYERSPFLLANAELADFVAWRAEMRSIEGLSAFDNDVRNLAIPNGSVAPVALAEVSPSAFQLVNVPPLLGRLLGDADEQPGAPAVAVIGYDLWHTRFLADPDVVGRTVHIGEREVTVVGVMPEGFAFPVNHSLWMPLEPARSEASSVEVFGRLAAGASIATARAEVATLMSRAARGGAEAPARRSDVVPYSQAFLDFSSASAYSVNLSVIMFLVLLCANVALLLFVRVASREGEMVVRSALGASRRRIMAQLVAEALGLATLAVGLGLGLAAVGLRSGIEAFQLIDGELPYWVSDRLSPRSVTYAVALAFPCALVAGVLPALNVTRGGLEMRLRNWGIGGTTMRLGSVWSVAIVAQVALVVTFVPTFLRLGTNAHEIRTADLGVVDPLEYLVASVQTSDGRPLPADSVPVSSAGPEAYLEFKQRLAAEPGIAGVTLASLLPGGGGSQGTRMEVDETAIDRGPVRSDEIRAHTTHVDVDYFDVLDMRIVAGRGYRSADLQSDAGMAIVNESFVREMFGGRNPIGVRIRQRPRRFVLLDRELPEQRPPPWHEIVGVVSDVRLSFDPQATSNAGIYYPAAPRRRLLTDLATPPLDNVIVRIQGDPSSFSARLAGIAAEVDPNLRVDDVLPLDYVRSMWLRSFSIWLQLAFVAGGLAALLAVSGVYSIMSFTVTRRTREIGIRLTLGATRRHVVSAVFPRALAQVGLGGALGGVVLTVFENLGSHTLTGVPLLAASGVVLLGAGVAACTVPVRRALRVQPTEAIATGG